MNVRAWIIAALLAAAQLRGQDLPKHAPGNSLDFEPKLMLDGPGVKVPDSTPAPATPDDRVRQLEIDVVRAEQRAAGSDQLYKEGILAKVEVEGRMLRVIQLEKELADARAAAAGAHCDEMKQSVAAHEASQGDLDAANAALETARQAAQAASAAWDKAQRDAATLDLERKRKLYAEGVATKVEVEMAEDRLSLLSGTAGQTPSR